MRLAEARGHLRDRLSRDEQAHRKIDVIHLDISAVAHVELNLRNREQPSARRAPLTTIESAALAVGDAFIEHGLGSRGTGFSLAVARILDQEDLFPKEDRAAVARETIASIADFVKGICGETCPHRCLANPKGDGRIPYYVEGLPWEEPAPVNRREPKGWA